MHDAVADCLDSSQVRPRPGTTNEALNGRVAKNALHSGTPEACRNPPCPSPGAEMTCPVLCPSQCHNAGVMHTVTRRLHRVLCAHLSQVCCDRALTTTQGFAVHMPQQGPVLAIPAGCQVGSPEHVHGHA